MIGAQKVMEVKETKILHKLIRRRKCSFKILMITWIVHRTSRMNLLQNNAVKKTNISSC